MLPGAPFPPRFTLGRVLALAWRGYRRRWIAVTVICLAAGLAGAFTLRLLQPVILLADGIWRALLIELLQFGPSIILALPAIALLLATHAGYPAPLRDVLGRSVARCGEFGVAEILFDGAAALLLILINQPPTPGLSLIVIVVNIAAGVIFVGFNCVYMPTLADEPISPVAALRRAFSLASGHWLRLMVLGLMIVISAWTIALLFPAVLQQILFSVDSGFLYVLHMDLIDPIMQGLAFGLRLILLVAISTAAYHLLQQLKDGRPTHEMAQVFD
jgi:hypothetical protein